MKHFQLLIVTLFFHGLTSCGGGDSPESAAGFDTPGASLDAYGAALAAGDEAAFRSVAAMNSSAIEGLDAIISIDKDTPPEEAARINLIALADMQGFAEMGEHR